MVNLRITYDPRADAAYLYFRKRTSDDPKREVWAIGTDLLADLGAAGEMTGLEILRASFNLPKELLEQAEILNDDPGEAQ